MDFKGFLKIHTKQWLKLLSNKENSENNDSTHISHEIFRAS